MHEMHTRWTSPVAMSRTTPLSIWHRGQLKSGNSGRLPPGMSGNKLNTPIGRSMEKNHLMRQVELETIPCVDPPKANNPEVRPLCGPDRSRWWWHHRLVDWVWNGLVKLHTTPKNLLELWRQGAQNNLAKRAPDSTSGRTPPRLPSSPLRTGLHRNWDGTLSLPQHGNW